ARYIGDGSLLARFDERSPGRLCHLNAKRRVTGNDPGDLHRAPDLLSNRHHLLDEPDAIRFGGRELVAEQQVIHGIPPARPCDVPEMPSAKRSDAALRFHLAEAAIVGRDDDVTCQHYLDADRVDDALDGGDDWLAALLRQAAWVDVALRKRLACRRR